MHWLTLLFCLANHERSLRIRASQDIPDHKPKLANPWTSPEPKV